MLAGRQVRILDGSVINAPGSQGTDWRLHATCDPAGGRFTDLELTDCHGSEGFARGTLRPGDIALGDRDYAKAAALAGVLAQRADFIVRLGWSSLRLLSQSGGDGVAADHRDRRRVRDGADIAARNCAGC